MQTKGQNSFDLGVFKTGDFNRSPIPPALRFKRLRLEPVRWRQLRSQPHTKPLSQFLAPDG
jgi:hypothetical protein